MSPCNPPPSSHNVVKVYNQPVHHPQQLFEQDHGMCGNGRYWCHDDSTHMGVCLQTSYPEPYWFCPNLGSTNGSPNLGSTNGSPNPGSTKEDGLQASSMERVHNFPLHEDSSKSPLCGGDGEKYLINCSYDLDDLKNYTAEARLAINKELARLVTQSIWNGIDDDAFLSHDFLSKPAMCWHDLDKVDDATRLDSDCGGAGQACCPGEVPFCHDNLKCSENNTCLDLCSNLKNHATVSPKGECQDHPLGRLACAPTNKTPLAQQKYWVCDMKNSCPWGANMTECVWDGLAPWSDPPKPSSREPSKTGAGSP